jgi:hypothetical protein
VVSLITENAIQVRDLGTTAIVTDLRMPDDIT